jgi:predicted RND superfamily exporter protein
MEVKSGNIKRILGTYEDYVWQLEEEAEKEFGGNQKVAIEEKYDENGKKSPDKEARKKLYELKKELSKLEKKISSLQDLVANGVDAENNQTTINHKEIRWLEVQTEIEGLEG